MLQFVGLASASEIPHRRAASFQLQSSNLPNSAKSLASSRDIHHHPIPAEQRLFALPPLPDTRPPPAAPPAENRTQLPRPAPHGATSDHPTPRSRAPAHNEATCQPGSPLLLPQPPFKPSHRLLRRFRID